MFSPVSVWHCSALVEKCALNAKNVLFSFIHMFYLKAHLILRHGQNVPKSNVKYAKRVISNNISSKLRTLQFVKWQKWQNWYDALTHIRLTLALNQYPISISLSERSFPAARLSLSDSFRPSQVGPPHSPLVAFNGEPRSFYCNACWSSRG